MRRVLLNPISEDKGKLLENCVFLHLRRSLSLLDKLYYFKQRQECDFVLVRGDETVQLIQVCYSLEDRQTRSREIDGLMEAAQYTGCRQLLILTYAEEEEILQETHTISVRPVWKWMLETQALSLP